MKMKAAHISKSGGDWERVTTDPISLLGQRSVTAGMRHRERFAGDIRIQRIDKGAPDYREIFAQPSGRNLQAMHSGKVRFRVVLAKSARNTAISNWSLPRLRQY